MARPFATLILMLGLSVPAYAGDLDAELTHRLGCELSVLPVPEQRAEDEDIAHYIDLVAQVTDRVLAETTLEVAPDAGPHADALAAIAEGRLDVLTQSEQDHPVLGEALRRLIRREVDRAGLPDVLRLREITLAADADDRAAWQYVRAIAQATEDQRRVSGRDPEVAMLAVLGERHMAVLIDALSLPALRFYAGAAIRDAVCERHKDLILAALPEQQRLISIIQQQGWEADARDQLIAGVNCGLTYMPRSWVQALAQLEDPATFDALALQLLRERSSKHYYILVKDLPGIELDDAVAASWERVNTSPTHARELREVSQIAVGHGHRPALDYLINLLPDGPSANPAIGVEVRSALLTHLNFDGTNQELRDWYHANADRLSFDRVSRKFYVAVAMH